MENKNFNLEDIINLPDCVEMNRKSEISVTNPITSLAFQELVKTDPVFLSKSDYLSWIKKYNSLFEQCQLDKNADKKFKLTFIHLSKLASYFQYEQEVEMALKEFQALNQTQEIVILTWLVKYEKLGLILFEMGFEYFDNDREYENNFISLFPNQKEIYINQDDFNKLLKFQITHNTLYWDKLQKIRAIN